MNVGSTVSRQADAKDMPARGASLSARIFFFAAVGIVVLMTVVRTAIWWKTDAGISFASGVMITMAADLAHGIFYRPLFGPMGYGGTRYFPLYFCLQGLLLKLGVPVLMSAYLISATGAALLIWGTFRLLRELGVETWLATGAALMLLGASSVQIALTTPQADGLAAALNVCGLAAIVRTPPNRRRILVAAVLFTLAWSAKLTTVFGVATAIIWLLSASETRAAWLLAMETACGYAVIAVGMVLGSRGRVVEIFRACASGGTDWRFVANAPLRMESMAVYTDPVLVAFAVLALLVLVSSKLWRTLRGILLITSLLVTVVIFGSPGTAQNHLLDVQVAAVIVLGTWVAKATPQKKRAGVYALALLTLLAGVELWRHVRTWSRWYHPHQFERVMAAAGAGEKPILAENPIVPVLAGQSPYVLDPWMVQLLRTRIAGFQEPLLQRLRRQEFGAVVLSTGAISENGAKQWFDENAFGPGFVEALGEHYKLAGVVDRDWIYLPKSESPGEGNAPKN